MTAGVVTSCGAGVEETARGLAACFHALRELVHASCRWLALVPHLEAKYALAEQLHDDARSARALSRRLRELRPPLDVNRPERGLAALLDRIAAADSPDAYLVLAYAEVKPRLAATVEELLRRVDPSNDEPSLRALIELRHRQAHHLAVCPVATGGPTPGAGGIPAEVLPGRPRRLAVAPAVERPARDPYLAVVGVAANLPTGAALIAGLGAAAEPPATPAAALTHALMHERLCWAETAARTSHEHPELPGAFHLDMAKLAWDAMRHAQSLERLLVERHGGHWGQHPVALSDFRRLYAPTLAQRLGAMREAARERLRIRPALDSPEAAGADGAEVRKLLDFLLADEQDHYESLSDWSARI